MFLLSYFFVLEHENLVANPTEQFIVDCDAYIGAISDGYGNWKWIDDSPWWANEYNDGLEGKTETKIVWRASDNKWNDWGIGNDLEGVICKTQGMLASLLLNI